MAALRGRCGRYIIVLWFLLLSIYIYISFSSTILSRRRLDVYHTSTQWFGLSENLGCRSKTCCTRLPENTGRKNCQKCAICAPSDNFVGLYLRKGGTYQQSAKHL